MVGDGLGDGAVTAIARATLLAATSEKAKAIYRALFLLLLASTFLRLLGTKVGAWAEGSLGFFSTVFIGVFAPAWLLVLFPTWLAFRVVHPRGPRALVLAACWFSPLVSQRELESIRAFVAMAAGRSFSSVAADVPADAWTALAGALQAEQSEDFTRARRIVEALKYLPNESAFPWLARHHGVEALVLAAWGRRDWGAVLARASIGRGRVVRLLALLARAELGQRVLPRRLWAAWALAPNRRGTFRAVRRALARKLVPARVTPAPPDPPAAIEDVARTLDVRLRHLSLLDVAGRGEKLSMRDVLGLAAAWRPHLDGAALARFSARGLELDVRDAGKQARELRETVLSELTALAASCEGEALAGAGGDVLANDVVARLREQLWKEAETALALVAPEAYVHGIHPLAAWERWLMLRAAVERLEKHGGGDAAAALWNTRVNHAVWNWACAVWNGHPKRAAWVAQMMYLWVAERAEMMGDMRTMVVNRENARIVLGA